MTSGEAQFVKLRRKLIVGIVALAFIGVWGLASAAQCYKLLDADGELLYVRGAPPFPIAWPEVSPEARASQARGEHLVIFQDRACGRSLPDRVAARRE